MIEDKELKMWAVNMSLDLKGRGNNDDAGKVVSDAKTIYAFLTEKEDENK